MKPEDQARIDAEIDAEIDEYRPVSGRQRLVIVVLAIATAIGVVLVLLHPPGGIVRKRPPAAAVPECAQGNPDATGCVGGMATVIAPAAAASR